MESREPEKQTREMKFYCIFLWSNILFFTIAGAGNVFSIRLGSILHPNSSSLWSSPNKTFSLGFISDPQNPFLFIAAITYNGGVPIWSLYGSVNSGGTLQLLFDGNLRLSNGSGAAVWESGSANRGVIAAVLDESGNFKLTNGTNSVVWQTFDNPTDTILESQSFTYGKILRSRDYSFTVLDIGNLTLVWNDSVTYYNNGLNSSFAANKSLDSPSLMLQGDGILVLSDSTLPSAVKIAFSSNYGESGDMLRFLRLDNDGNLRSYSVRRGSGYADRQWSAVTNQCQVFGWCGNMGICRYMESSPVCGCPSDNFEPVDPNDITLGCKRKTEIQDCPGNSTMLEMVNTQFLTYLSKLSTEQFFVGITACRLNCLSGISCVASTSLSDGSGLCYLKVTNFVSGYQSSSLPSTSFIKVCAPAAPYPVLSASSRWKTVSLKQKLWVMVIVILGAILGLVIVEGGLWWCFCRNRTMAVPPSGHHVFLEYASSALIKFSYEELRCSTNCFKEKLGAGGFGVVYKGILGNTTMLAVKQLKGIEQGEKQFRVEVGTISSTHHLNLVRLIGFCSDGRHRMLVYEFLKNGSLDRFLFSEKSEAFNWETRYKIAIGTARGVAYLHEECRVCIIHCDIKPENILLDENYNAKVSDFGLAKLVNVKDLKNRALTNVRGTGGYLSPEWLGNNPVTSACDVYSYGMVLLDIVGGRRNFDVSEGTGGKMFSVWAYEEYSRGNISRIVDSRLHDDSEIDMEQVERAIKVSFWCIQEQPSQRPLMSKVVQMLEGIIQILDPPTPKETDIPFSTFGKKSRLSIHSRNAASGSKISFSASFDGTSRSS